MSHDSLHFQDGPVDVDRGERSLRATFHVVPVPRPMMSTSACPFETSYLGLTSLLAPTLPALSLMRGGKSGGAWQSATEAFCSTLAAFFSRCARVDNDLRLQSLRSCQDNPAATAQSCSVRSRRLCLGTLIIVGARHTPSFLATKVVQYRTMEVLECKNAPDSRNVSTGRYQW